MTFDSTQLVPGSEDVNRALLDLLDKVNRRLDNLESITAKTVNATTVKADTVQAQTVTTQDLSATNGTIDALSADSGDFTTSLTLGGYPVVESGSNANGNWTKWSDGTMICISPSITATGVPVTTAYAGGFRSISTAPGVWTFPQSFISTPAFSFRTGSVNTDHLIVTQNTSGPTSTSCTVWRATSATVDTSWFAIAIGRWR